MVLRRFIEITRIAGRCRRLNDTSRLESFQSPSRHTLFFQGLLYDLHTDADVFLDSSQNFVVHAEGFHPIFEGAKLI